MCMSVEDGEESDEKGRHPQRRARLADDRESQRDSRKGYADLDARQPHPDEAEHSAKRHDHRKGDRKEPHGRRAELRAPKPNRDHREHVVETRDGVPEAAHETQRLATPCVGEGGGRPGQEEKEQRSETAPLHRTSPKMLVVLWMVQKAPSDSTTYPGGASTHRGHWISRWRNDRSRRTTSRTNATWPISSPTLKPNSAIGRSLHA